MDFTINDILCGDALKLLKKLPCNSIHCIVTSPAYWGLRDYGVKGQLGMEETPQKYVQRLMRYMKECYRVLRNDGTMWLNIGDCYAAAPKKRTVEQATRKSTLTGSKGTQISCKDQINKVTGDLKPKDLVGIPWMVAFAMRKAGWYLRCDIIWNKPNPMPESVSDRPTKAHEYIFLLTKSDRYFYDAEAIKTPAKYPGITGMDASRFKDAKTYNGKHSDKQRGHGRRHAGFNDRWDNMTAREQMSMGANKRSVWTIPTKPFPEAHFATFPPELITDCIKAGCPEGGIVLDPFMGAGTTGIVAAKLNRRYLGFELNPKYVEMSKKRLHKELGLFKITQNATIR